MCAHIEDANAPEPKASLKLHAKVEDGEHVQHQVDHPRVQKVAADDPPPAQPGSRALSQSIACVLMCILTHCHCCVAARGCPRVMFDDADGKPRL